MWKKHSAVLLCFGLTVVVKGIELNNELSEAARGGCCQERYNCCPHGYRCDLKLSNCVRGHGGVYPPLDRYPTGFRGPGPHSEPDPVLTLSHSPIINPANCPSSGTYCWDVDACCLIQHGYNSLWARAEGTCCTRYRSPKCPRIRGCRATSGDQRYKSHRNVYLRKSGYYGAADPVADPSASAALLLLSTSVCLTMFPTSKL
ncbi:uncharacterized protein LOC144162069 [Haemaphysalis longicornis]